ncbi:MAG: UvrD-helicase domain-containing protein [Bilophila wadsworthia]
MKYFRADLHVHSRFSRATSGRLNIRNLAAWSMIKGLSVMSTGDFTHPAWRDELRRDLVYDDNSGLYRVREKTPLETEIPGFSRPDGASEPQFLIQAEISSIYKKDGSVRKVHNVVITPSLESADKLSNKLAAIGNITSDGRPILASIASISLKWCLKPTSAACSFRAYLDAVVFAFGSKSGFDALEDCFGSLSSHIFALETGLSSDPDMNRLWSALDRYALVSNSDAHSGENLGREANLFEGTPSYDGIFDALRRAARDEEGSGCIYRGTVEFFPEEGKYHLDGHRACNVVLEPEESMKIGNICPVCGKPLTVGVLHRVMALADRKAPVMPKHDPGFVSLFPLPEMLGELLSVGPKSRKVQERQSELVRLFGSEMDILHTVPESDLRQHWDALGEAVARGAGRRHQGSGLDGEYGVVKVFSEEERKQFVTGRYRSSSLLMLCPKPKTGQKTQSGTFQGTSIETGIPVRGNDAPGAPDAARSEGVPVFRSAAESHPSRPNPVLVLRAPVPAKPAPLWAASSAFLKDGIPAQRILAVTFTRRAAAELRERLERALGEGVPLPQADTLHALALSHWGSAEEALPAVLPEETARSVFAKANALSAADARRVWDELSLARERLAPLTDEQSALQERYHAAKRERKLADYTDLLEHWLARLQAEPERQWTNVLVDEIQDLSPLQVALVRALMPGDGHGFFGIGDPDQAIYGFRGAHPDVQSALREAWPSLESVTLAASHRSAAGILTSASALLGLSSACGKLIPTRNTEACLHLFSAPDARKEAAWVADQVALLLGGTSHTLEDSRRRDATLATPCSPGEVAVLVRMKALIPPLKTALERRGVPCSAPETAPFWGDPSAALILELAGLRFQRPFAAPEGPGSLDVDVPQLAASLPEQLWQAGPSALASHLDAAKLLAPLFTESAACNALLRAFREQGKTWEGLLDWVCLRQDLDLVREQAEQVQIMTLHAAKGLEFRPYSYPPWKRASCPSPARMRCFTATPAALSIRTRSRKSGACSMSA